VSRKIFLPVLVLVLTILACSTQTSTVAPSSPTVTGGPMSDITDTPESFITDTPVQTATNTPLPPALPVLASPALARIDFQDENNGWGIAVNSDGYVLRTVDGGATWLNATPPGIGTIGFSTNLTVLNANTAWVAVPAPDFFSGTLYRTSDGGITWNSNPVPFGGAYLQFLDASIGRALVDRGAGAGSEAVELFQTSDGGVTWVSVFHNDSSQPGSSDSLPLGGIKNGMTFLDANTGWVTGSIPADGNIYLYITRDGGVSWSQQSVPLPAGYATYQYMPQAPVFFGNEGFLPLTVYLPDRTDLTFYTTHDGGLPWSGDPADPIKVIKPGLTAFADAHHIWSWDGGKNLYFTTDGAQTWEHTIATPDLSGRLSQLEFVSGPADRFTGWALTRQDDAGHGQLYRTTGGYDWMLLLP
jgi:photosystem II stability/assembly factor-like uncharacterized protein